MLVSEPCPLRPEPLLECLKLLGRNDDLPLPAKRAGRFSSSLSSLAVFSVLDSARSESPSCDLMSVYVRKLKGSVGYILRDRSEGSGTMLYSSMGCPPCLDA